MSSDKDFSQFLPPTDPEAQAASETLTRALVQAQTEAITTGGLTPQTAALVAGQFAVNVLGGAFGDLDAARFLKQTAELLLERASETERKAN